MNFSQPDLTIHPPRSARVRIGGVVALARMLDKCRATLTQKNGEYHYNCPLDQRCLSFLGITAEALTQEAAKGSSDSEIWAWIQTNSTTKPTAWDVIQWSNWQETRTPSDVGSREYFHGIHQAVASGREDISTWFDLLDMDDFASYGGKA